MDREFGSRKNGKSVQTAKTREPGDDRTNPLVHCLVNLIDCLPNPRDHRSRQRRIGHVRSF